MGDSGLTKLGPFPKCMNYFYRVTKECPSCFKQWQENTDKYRLSVSTTHCEYCKDKELSPRERLRRQIDVLEFMPVPRYAEVIRNMYNLMVFKEEEFDE